MNELQFQDGGRRLHNDDLQDLQDHILATQRVFASESPFVMSGINFTDLGGGNYDVSDGYIWLGNKVRYFSGVSNYDLSVPTFINAIDVNEQRQYEDGASKLALTLYSTVISGTGSGGNDEIRIDDIQNIRRYYENVIGDKFLNTETTQGQQVQGFVDFLTDIQANQVIGTNVIGLNTISAPNLNVNAQATLADTNINGSLVMLSGTLATLYNVDVNGTLNTGSLNVATAVIADSFSTNSTTPVPVIRPDGIIGANFVEEDSIQDGAVTENKLGAGAVTTSKLEGGAVTEGKIGAGAVTSNKLGTDSVNENKIADDSIRREHILDGEVLGAAIGNGEITNVKIDDNAIDNRVIDTDAISIDNMQDDSVGTNELVDASVTKIKIAPDLVDTAVYGLTNEPASGAILGFEKGHFWRTPRPSGSILTTIVLGTPNTYFRTRYTRYWLNGVENSGTRTSNVYLTDVAGWGDGRLQLPTDNASLAVEIELLKTDSSGNNAVVVSKMFVSTYFS